MDMKLFFASKRVFSNASKGGTPSVCPYMHTCIRLPPPIPLGNHLGIDQFESFFACFEEGKHDLVCVM